MSHSFHEGTSGGYVPADADTDTSSPGNENTVLKTPRPATLVCPVSDCSLVFGGKMPHGYLWRHLKRPGAHGRTGDEKYAWENLHKIEHDRLLTTHVTPAQRKREARRVKVQKVLRTAEFEERARNMGITEKTLISQKVAIWEGIRAAEQHGKDIEISLPVRRSFSK